MHKIFLLFISLIISTNLVVASPIPAIWTCLHPKNGDKPCSRIYEYDSSTGKELKYYHYWSDDIYEYDSSTGKELKCYELR